MIFGLERFQAIRDAVQFELNSFHFYKLARDRAAAPDHQDQNGDIDCGGCRASQAGGDELSGVTHDGR